MRRQRLTSTDAPPAIILIRLMVGAVFLSEGMQKFRFCRKLWMKTSKFITSCDLRSQSIELLCWRLDPVPWGH
jgi:uncharacterized membrane protein YphA (DoxX/SURF4 family)